MIKDNTFGLRSCFMLYFLATMSYACWCQPKPMEREQDKKIFAISTASVKQVGAVSKAMPVLDFKGHITINEIDNEDPHLLIVIIPSAVEVKEAVEEFRAIDVDFDDKDKSKAITLPNMKGYVYPIHKLNRGQSGDITTKVVFDAPLLLGKYKGYFIAKTEQHGIYYSLEGQEFEIIADNSALDPAISIVPGSPKAERVIGSRDIQINVRSLATNFASSSYTGGFLFIDQSLALTPQSLIADLMRKDQSIPTVSTFTTFPGNAKVIFCSFKSSTVLTPANDLVDEREFAASSVFLKGGNYNVYAYMVSAELEYAISSEIEVITIPKVEVELKMEEVELDICAYYLKNDTDPFPVGGHESNLNYTKFKICKGTISKNEGTKNAKGGFLFVPDASLGSPAAAIEDVKRLLLANNKVDNLYKDSSPHSFKALSVQSIDDRATGDIFMKDLACVGNVFKKPAQYYVYFWMKDDTDNIFVSDVTIDKTVKIGVEHLLGFKKITKFECQREGGVVAIITDPPDFENLTEGAFTKDFNTATAGGMLCTGLPSEAEFKHILTRMINVKPNQGAPTIPKPSRQLSLTNQNIAFASCHSSLLYTSLQETFPLKNEGIKGNLWLFAAQGASIAYQQTGVKDFYFMSPLPPDRSAVVTYNSSDYTVRAENGLFAINRIDNNGDCTPIKWVKNEEDDINGSSADDWFQDKKDDWNIVNATNIIIFNVLKDFYRKGIKGANKHAIKHFIENMGA